MFRLDLPEVQQLVLIGGHLGLGHGTRLRRRGIDLADRGRRCLCGIGFAGLRLDRRQQVRDTLLRAIEEPDDLLAEIAQILQIELHGGEDLAQGGQRVFVADGRSETLGPRPARQCLHQRQRGIPVGESENLTDATEVVRRLAEGIGPVAGVLAGVPGQAGIDLFASGGEVLVRRRGDRPDGFGHGLVVKRGAHRRTVHAAGNAGHHLLDQHHRAGKIHQQGVVEFGRTVDHLKQPLGAVVQRVRRRHVSQRTQHAAHLLEPGGDSVEWLEVVALAAREEVEHVLRDQDLLLQGLGNRAECMRVQSDKPGGPVSPCQLGTPVGGRVVADDRVVIDLVEHGNENGGPQIEARMLDHDLAAGTHLQAEELQDTAHGPLEQR